MLPLAWVSVGLRLVGRCLLGGAAVLPVLLQDFQTAPWLTSSTPAILRCESPSTLRRTTSARRCAVWALVRLGRFDGLGMHTGYPLLGPGGFALTTR